jgi:hypothetical protein
VVTSHELSVLLKKGLELKSTYDFYDPDRSLKTGSKSRWGLGVMVMPRTFLVAEASFRSTHYSQGPALAFKDFDEGLFQLHLLY